MFNLIFCKRVGILVTPFHCKYYANQLLLKKSYSDDSRLSSSLFDAALNINPHQVDAALFAFNSPLSKGVLLADEVGLGKTIEAGLVLCQLWAEGKRRLIVICPAALRKQWSIELQEKFNLPSMILDSQSYKQYKKDNGVSPFNHDNIFILSYNYAAKLSDEILSHHFYLVVLDEAHKLRNAYRTSNKLGQVLVPAIRGIRKILLTATPMQNNLTYIFGDIKSFRANYAGSSDLGDLKKRLNQFCYRTLRKDVMEYIKYTARHPIVFKFKPSKLENTLYEKISQFLQREYTYAVPVNQRHIVTLVVRKVLASSTNAVINTLQTILKRLETLRAQATEKVYVDKDNESVFILDGDDDLKYLISENLEDDVFEDDDERDSFDTIDLGLLNKEIEEIKGFLDIATHIKKDAKAEKLLLALDEGFKQTNKLGGNKKALIFTESTRTQKFLKDFLEENCYKGKLVLFNGSNSGAETTAIYNDWLEKNKYTGRCSGSKTADKRNALIEYFRDSAEIMIATESAAEGVNLQFCSLVINYDLPWNPQRIEQRIGRCHRYGQKNDVVVINFINESNDVDRRVYELLAHKFNLFNGVFGSSDEVLGAVESGIDFERKILEIYQQCRTQEEIEKSFNELQKSMEEIISKNIQKAHEDLFKNFDSEVFERLKLNIDEYLDKFSRQFWLLSEYILHEKAEFNDDDHSFYLKDNIDNIISGKYALISKKYENNNGIIYRTNHPLGEYVIKEGLNIPEKCGKVIFDITNNGGYKITQKITQVENLKGCSGYLSLYKYTINSFDKEEHLLFAGIMADGKEISHHTCEKLFECMGKYEPVEIDENINMLLKEKINIVAENKSIESEQNNMKYFQQEEERLEGWAKDMVQRLEIELKNIKDLIREKERQARHASSMEEKYNINKELQELNSKKSKMRRNLEDNEDAVYEKRNALIDEIKSRMVKDTKLEEIYTIAWEVI